MYFSSISDLVAMDGHGAYVWSAYAIVAVALLFLVVEAVLRRRRVLQRVRRRLMLGDRPQY